jgi:thioredoxin-related protein
MPRLPSLLAIVCLFLSSTAPGRAIGDLETAAIPDRPLELLVVEISNCLYCGLFRRDVAPTYKASERARTVPMRFIDINAPDVDRLALQSPIDSVPTVLVVENGREVGRIAGYVGPEIFFHSLNRILPDTGP